MQCEYCRSDCDYYDDDMVTCECCGNSYHVDIMYWDDQLGCYLCEDCRDNQVVECAECHQRTFIQDSIWQRETGTNICVRCHYRLHYSSELELEDDEDLLPF
jgi:predicted CXXCH cytochrome family protein